jgi:hypothetical protein
MMRSNRMFLALFAAAILFSMVREWSAPVSCARANLALSSPSAHSRQ